MKKLANFLDRYQKLLIDSIQIGMVAKIERFYPDEMRADVLPLLKQENESGDLIAFAPMSRIPVGYLQSGDYLIKPHYQNGDLVWISFATHSIENALSGLARKASMETFDLSNASVAYGIRKTNADPSPLLSMAGLVIGEKTGKALIQIEGENVKIQGGISATVEKTVLGETLKNWLESVVSIFIDNAGTLTSNVALGVPAQLNPTIVTQLNLKKGQLSDILSGKVKIG